MKLRLGGARLQLLLRGARRRRTNDACSPLRPILAGVECLPPPRPRGVMLTRTQCACSSLPLANADGECLPPPRPRTCTDCCGLQRSRHEASDLVEQVFGCCTDSTDGEHALLCLSRRSALAIVSRPAALAMLAGSTRLQVHAGRNDSSSSSSHRRAFSCSADDDEACQRSPALP